MGAKRWNRREARVLLRNGCLADYGCNFTVEFYRNCCAGHLGPLHDGFAISRQPRVEIRVRRGCARCSRGHNDYDRLFFLFLKSKYAHLRLADSPRGLPKRRCDFTVAGLCWPDHCVGVSDELYLVHVPSVARVCCGRAFEAPEKKR